MDKPDPERASHFLLVRELLAGLVEKNAPPRQRTFVMITLVTSSYRAEWDQPELIVQSSAS
jgi:hypothetical protein